MIDLLNCNWSQAYFLIFSNNVYDPLIYYSHLLPLISSIILGLFVFFSNRKLLINKLFFILTLLFSVWVYFDLILWATGNIQFEMFFWAIIVPVEFLIFATAFFLTKEFIGRSKISNVYKILFSIFFVPILLFTHTKYNLTAFDFTNCDRAAIEGPLITYLYIIEGIIFLITLGEIIYALIKDKDKKHRIKSAIFSAGIITFLGLFIIGNVTIIQDIGWGYEQYKLFGMIVFLLILVFLIVKFKAFNIKLLGTQALVWALVILVGSEFLFVTNLTSQILVGITLVISAVVGTMIVRGMKKEIAQKEQIGKLAESLEKTNFSLENANEKLKELDQLKTEFVSLTTHQIRGSLTALKGYASMILEGDFGEVPEKVKEPIGIIYESSRSLEEIVEDFLDVSRIEQGKMKYNLEKVDFKELVKHVIEELRPTIDKTKLAFSFSFSGDNFMVNADKDKIKQVVLNFIDNSLKYTTSGGVNVRLENVVSGGKKVVRFSVKDTGVGISKDTLPKLFEKFSRAKDANKTNILGTGLGLYVAKKMVEAHEGRLWAESEGEGKGSTFFVELEIV